MNAETRLSLATEHSPRTKVETMPNQNPRSAGFSLVEMLVAITVTTIIMGSVYGLMAQGQAAFGREPFLADRQQQARIAMDRIQEDVLSGGTGLGIFAQSFATGLNGDGPQGVRTTTDSTLGGANSDALEVRRQSPECAPVRVDLGTPLVGEALQTVDTIGTCFPDPGWVFLMYPDSRSKLGWLSNHPTNPVTDDASTFADPQPRGSQILAAAGSPGHVTCSVWFGTQNTLVSPNGNSCPNAAGPDATLGTADDLDPPPLVPVVPCPACGPYAIQQADVIRYRIGTDVDGTIGLFRSVTGGVDTTGALTTPPGAAWQLVAIGIEDLQVEYRTTTSGATWLNEPPLVPETSPNEIVLEIRVTLWARALTPPNLRLTGETRSQGADATGVQAVRGSLVSIIAPRSVQNARGTLGVWK